MTKKAQFHSNFPFTFLLKHRYGIDLVTILVPLIIFHVFFPDGEENSSTKMMYYINDGVYGSVSCLINDPAHINVAPYLHKVNLNCIAT